jgi:nucleotide-binding universal stress UspA family protein
MQVAEQTGARLTILAVVPRHGSGDRGAGRRLEARVRLARRRGIDVWGWMATGDPGECVVEAAGAIGADAIIMGPDQWPTLRTPGCLCGHVLLRAPCSVLIARAG